MHVHGENVDPHTRCAHYHTTVDIIAIKMRCCGRFYACYDCHSSLAGHPPARWTSAELGERAVLCGACRHALTIEEYLDCGYRCPACQAQFNPRCALHHHLYFDAHVLPRRRG